MNSFDTNIISFFNKFAQRSYTFDQIAVIFDDVRDISKFIFHILEVTVKFVE